MCNAAFFRGLAHRCSANTVPLAATPLQSVLLTKLFSCDCSPFADFTRSLRPLRVCRALTYVLAALAVSPTRFLRCLPLPALTPAHHHLPHQLGSTWDRPPASCLCQVPHDSVQIRQVLCRCPCPPPGSPSGG